MATLVLVDTDENRRLVPPKHRGKAVIAPVGAGHEWFQQRSPTLHPRRSAAGKLSVIFFGLFTPLQGAPVITTALARLHGVAAIQVTMVGTGQHRAASQELAEGTGSIEWLDWVEPDALHGLVQRSDICLGIFGSTAKAARVVPNKVYQGAAAGCAIITSDTAPQRRALGDAAVYVTPGDPEALSAALLTLVRNPAEVDRLRKLAAERAYARFQPRHVAGPLFTALKEVNHA
jgi:glycosyltransferase involved in cell wall biosynthesis